MIEVSVTSQALDLQVKPAIYAAADVSEYWVLDVPAREVVVHTDPGRPATAWCAASRGASR